jgi:hypothetical protein
MGERSPMLIPQAPSVRCSRDFLLDTFGSVPSFSLQALPGRGSGAMDDGWICHHERRHLRPLQHRLGRLRHRRL